MQDERREQVLALQHGTSNFYHMYDPARKENTTLSLVHKQYNKNKFAVSEWGEGVGQKIQ